MKCKSCGFESNNDNQFMELDIQIDIMVPHNDGLGERVGPFYYCSPSCAQHDLGTLTKAVSSKCWDNIKAFGEELNKNKTEWEEYQRRNNG